MAMSSTAEMSSSSATSTTRLPLGDFSARASCQTFVDTPTLVAVSAVPTTTDGITPSPAT
jgi:hypothetical protein